MPKWSNEKIQEATAVYSNQIRDIFKKQGEVQQRMTELATQIAELQLQKPSPTDPDTEELAALKIEHAELFSKSKALRHEENKAWESINQVVIQSYDSDYEAIMHDVKKQLRIYDKERYLQEFIRPIKKAKKEYPERFKNPIFTRGYYSYRHYLLSIIKTQVQALDFYKFSKDELEALVDAQAESAYVKPAGRKKPKAPSDAVCAAILEPVNSPYDYLPGGIMSTMARDVLSAGSAIEDLESQKWRINRNVKYTVSPEDPMEQLEISLPAPPQTTRITRTHKSGDSVLSMKVDNLFTLSPGNTNASKILNKILIETGKVVKNGELINDVVSFPLSSLVGKGRYTCLNSARQAFYDTTDIITSIKFSGYINGPGGKTMKQGRHIVPFPSAIVDDSTCVIRLNQDFSWGMMMQYYIPLPPAYFTLPGKAADLFLLLFQTARANAHKADPKSGVIKFTIKYDTIRYALSLPDPRTRKIANPTRDIKDKIDGAIEAIEVEASRNAPRTRIGNEKNPKPDLQLLPTVDEKAKIKDYLENGKLVVTFKGELAQNFIDVARKEAEHIRKIESRKSRTSNGKKKKETPENSDK